KSARKGMKDLPWPMALGPQMGYKPQENIDLSLGAFAARTTDFRTSQFPGQIYQAKIHYAIDIPSIYEMRGHLFYTLKYASRGLQKIYYETGTYEAKPGIMSQEISYYQTVKMGRTNLYVGFS